MIFEAKKIKHHPYQVWRTSRGNYRSLNPAGKERSFKTYKDAVEWLQSYNEKEKELFKLKIKKITPKGELRKVLGFIRDEFERAKEQDVNYEKVIRQVYAAISKIHIKML